MRKMLARRRDRCIDCGGEIEVGEMIEWSRTLGAKHADDRICKGVRDAVEAAEAEPDPAPRPDRI
jgi:hypothetical protein